MEALAERPSQSRRTGGGGACADCGFGRRQAESACSAQTGAPGDYRAERRESNVCGRPRISLRARGQIRFHQQRVTEQRKHRSEIGEREQAVRHAALVGARIPRLQERTGGGEQEIWQADGGREQCENLQRWRARGGLPHRVGQNRKGRQANRQRRRVDRGLRARAQLFVYPMRVEIAEQEGQLEEQHAGAPDGRRSAKPGQNHFGYYRLYGEEQESR